MNTLSTTLRQTIGSLRLVWLIYGITLVLGLLVALPFYNTLKAEDENSRAFLNLLQGFDYTIYSDFMHRSGRAINPLLSVGRWLGTLYIFLSLFFAGGILLQFTQPNRPFQAGSFWQGCQHYFGRFLGLFGVTGLFVLVGAGIWLVAGSVVGAALSDTFTERGLFWIGVLFFGLFLLTATVVFCIGDYAKVVMFRNDERNAFRAFGQAGRLILKNPAKTYGLYALLMLTGTVLFALYFLIDDLLLMSGWLTIIVMLLVQQTLIFARTLLRIWSLGVAYTVFATLPQPAPTIPLNSVYSPANEPVDPTLLMPDFDNNDLWTNTLTKTQAKEQQEHEEFVKMQAKEPHEPDQDDDKTQSPTV